LAILRPREAGLRWGKKFWLHLTTASTERLHLFERFFIFPIVFADEKTAGHYIAAWCYCAPFHVSHGPFSSCQQQ